MDKKISVATVAKRMNRILAAYREQRAQETQSDDGTSPVASTSSSSSSSSSQTSSSMSPSKTSCPAERKMVLDKAILNFAAQIDTNESDSDDDVSDPSFSFVESPPKRRCLSNNAATVNPQQQSKRRRSQPSRTVKRAAVKITTLPMKRAPRKVSCTITSATKKSSSPNKRGHEQSSSSDSYSDASMVMEFPDSDDDSDTAAPATKTSKLTKPTKPAKPTKPTKSIKSSILIKTT